MTAHATPEALSLWIDGELPPGDVRGLADHVEACPSCHARLASMRGAVGSLHRLERAAPPSTLAQHVYHRIALEERHLSPLQRFEERLRRVRLEPAMAATFGVVMALAVLFYLLAQGAQRAGVRGLPIVVPTPEAARAWQESTPDARGVRAVGGRRFERAGDTWVETGLDPAAPRRTVSAASAEGARLLAEHPWLAGLLSAAERVELASGGEVIALEGAGSGSSGDPARAEP